MVLIPVYQLNRNAVCLKIYKGVLTGFLRQM